MADAHIADPEELQVLDRFLPIKLVVRASGPNLIFRNTKDSLQMTPVQYLVPYSCDYKSIKTQTNNIHLT